MDFNDLNSFYVNLEKEVEKSLKELAIEIHTDIYENILTMIYETYEPERYKRTKLLLESAEIVPVHKSNGKWIMEVRIKNDAHSNISWYNAEEIGIKYKGYATLSQIMESFAEGYPRGTSIDPMGKAYKEWIETGKILNEIISMLSAKFDIDFK